MNFRTLNRLRRTSPLQLAVLLAGLGAAWLGLSGGNEPSAANQTMVCTVSHVHDGDTLRADCPGQKKTTRVRIRQIDAPELDQKYGIASRDFLRNLCPKNEAVKLYVTSKDQYGRLLADAECNGQDVGITMVGAGAAWVYERYADDPALVAAQNRARQSRSGLWRHNDAVAPWQFRRQQNQ